MTNDRNGRRSAVAKAAPIRLLRDRYEPLHSLLTDKWFYACRGSRLQDPAGKADPLWMVCLRSILRNINIVTPEHIQAIPLQMRRRMCERIRSAQLDSVAVWQAFVPNGCQDIAFYKVCHVLTDYAQEGGMDGGLETYTRRLHSPSSDWLVSLLIAEVNISAADLSAIANLSNLQSLCIRSVPAVDDRTIRAWSRLASGIDSESGQSRYFQELKELELTGMRGITRQSWTFAWEFPRLEVFNVGDGWEITPRKGSSLEDQKRPPFIKLSFVATGSRSYSLEHDFNIVHHARKPRPERPERPDGVAASKSAREDEENIMLTGHGPGGQRHARDAIGTSDSPSRHRQMNPRRRKRLRASLEETIGI